MEGAKKILVAEDDPALIQLLSKLFRRRGLTVDPAASFDQALERIRAAPPKLLIADLNMPGMTALEFFKELERKEAFGRMKILIVSGSPPSAVLEAYLREKGWPYLTKPFDLDPFGKTVDRLLGR